jgi:8-amino-7-oxononanoate synthase
MYNRELEALQKRDRFRKREIYSSNLIDLASNDYLGLSENWEIFEKTVIEFRKLSSRSPKASMLVNGYSEVHVEFESQISKLHGFESGIVLGSGFLANFGLIETLVRKGDELFMDSEYHASGVVATKCLEKEQVHIFPHNSMESLESALKKSKAKRKIVAVEGVYSMSGDLVPKEVFEISKKYDAILIVDEAHSFGVVGENLLGVFDLYNITPEKSHIKMGTLGKAIGSYGAYILASSEIVSFLENRSKPLIYSTAPSLFETLISLNSINFISENRKRFADEVRKRRELFSKFGISKDALIFPIQIGDSKRALEIRDLLQNSGFLVGAIRPPTVQKAILRVVGNIKVSENEIVDFFGKLQILNR